MAMPKKVGPSPFECPVHPNARYRQLLLVEDQLALQLRSF